MTEPTLPPRQQLNRDLRLPKDAVRRTMLVLAVLAGLIASYAVQPRARLTFPDYDRINKIDLEQHYLVPAQSKDTTQVATEAQTPATTGVTKPMRKSSTKPKPKFVPRSNELAAGAPGWDPGPPRLSSQREKRWQARRNWRRDRAFLFGPP